MKIRFNLENNKDLKSKKQIEEYKLPESVSYFLKEKYSQDAAIEIAKYFILSINEKKISFLNWYLKDINELKVSLNLLENKKIKFDQNKNDQIVDLFHKFLEDKFDYIEIINEYYDEFRELPLDSESYELLFEKFFSYIEKLEEQEKKEEEQSLLIKVKGKKKKPRFLKHQWKGTLIRFEKAPGKWGKWVDLKGESGRNGKSGGGKGLSRGQVMELINSAISNDGFPTDFNETEVGGITYIEYKDYITG